ncbi:MAG: hypothetical protein V1885_00305 [Candidatus Brennerbacteria bacterium]
MYSGRVHHDKDVVDCYNVFNSSSCYECIDCQDGYALRYSRDSIGCSESQLLFDCRNCSKCVACVGLRNKKLHFLNKPIGEEEFQSIVLKLSSDRDFLNSVRKQFAVLRLHFPVKYAQVVKSVDSSGDRLNGCKNCKFSFDLSDCEDCTHLVIGGKNRNDCDVSYDDESELSYEVMSAHQDYGCKFSSTVWFSRDVVCSQHCMSSDSLFGCNSVRHKQYCILNKQYTKEEYEELAPRIIQHMNEMPYVDQKGRTYRYGEFFPPELSPFAYNETIAQEHFPLAKEQAIAQGYRWRDPDTKQYTITKLPKDLPDHIKDVDDSILKETIGCAHEGSCPHQCATAFKIIPEELAFYQRMNLPLPRLCPNCRYYERLSQRNPLKLWRRKCQCTGTKSEDGVYQNVVAHSHHGDGHCPNEFETSYAPDRKEIVYCEQCYQAEVV